MNNHEIIEYILHLEKEKSYYASQGQYLKAEELKNKINELKQNDLNEKKKELYLTHNLEIQDLEDLFKQELQSHEEKWKIIFLEFNERVTKQEDQINLNHNNEMKNCIDYFQSTFPNIKYSHKILGLKVTEANLVKQERFIEAHHTREDIENLEKIETIKYEKEKMEKLKLCTDKLTNIQNNEMTVFKRKIETEKESLILKKNEEREKLILSYKKKRFDLESQQNTETIINNNINALKSKHISMRLIKNNSSQSATKKDRDHSKNKTLHKNKLQYNNVRMDDTQTSNSYKLNDGDVINMSENQCSFSG